MLKTHGDYEKTAVFQEAHPLVAVNGDGFFDHQTKEDLQHIVDQTLKSLKSKRELTGGNPALRTAAMTLLKQHACAYGSGVEYAYTMVHKAPQSAQRPQVVPPKAH